MEKKVLYVIPARGGSKGIPKKNIKVLGDKPLIQYAIDLARTVATDDDICVSSDSGEILEVAQKLGLNVPFARPAELASDSSGSYEVLIHALDYYSSQGKDYDAIVMLQPTSPFREQFHVEESLELLSEDVEMVCSFCESHSSPYFNLYEENEQGYMDPSKPNTFTRRQDCPIVYEQNGAIFVFSVKALREQPISHMTNIKKYVMDQKYFVDLDTPLDWQYAEFLISKGHFS